MFLWVYFWQTVYWFPFSYNYTHRAINYDEKDPFLCNSCGVSKYAKFEYSMISKECTSVDPIETDEDRAKVSLQPSLATVLCCVRDRMRITYYPEVSTVY